MAPQPTTPIFMRTIYDSSDSLRPLLGVDGADTRGDRVPEIIQLVDLLVNLVYPLEHSVLVLRNLVVIAVVVAAGVYRLNMRSHRQVLHAESPAGAPCGCHMAFHAEAPTGAPCEMTISMVISRYIWSFAHGEYNTDQSL